MRFSEFMAGQEFLGPEITNNMTPQQQDMIKSVQPFIKTASQQHGPQAVQAAVQSTFGQNQNQNQGQAGQAGQAAQQGQMGQRPQNTQQPQTGQQTQMSQTNKVDPNQSKAFKDMLQKSLNNWKQNQTSQGQQTAQNGMNAFGMNQNQNI